jgi:hypothetical protein
MTKFYRERHQVDWLGYQELAKGVKLLGCQRFVDADVLELDETFKLACLGQPPGLSNFQYRCIVKETWFDIFVEREFGSIITGTAHISAVFLLRQVVGEASWPVDNGYWKALTAKIDAALRAWPTMSGQDAPPLGVTFFDARTEYWREKNLDVRVNDWSYRLKIGRPLSLHAAPPSQRWKSVEIESANGLPIDPKRLARATARVRDDGVRLIRVPKPRGPLNDGPDTFFYSDHSIQFEFSADRRFSRGIVSDTWAANFFDRQRRAPLLDPERQREVMEIIAEALYAWPPEPEDDDETPVNRVVFIDVDDAKTAI